MARRLRKIRFVHLHTFLFVLGWFPGGLRSFIFKLLKRLGKDTDYMHLFLPSVFLHYAVFILCPLSYVFLLEEIKVAEVFVPCIFRKVSRLPLDIEAKPKVEPPATTLLNQKPTTKREVKLVTFCNSFQLMEMSRVSTFGVTETSASLSGSMSKITPIKRCVNIPATPSSALKLKQIRVEVHTEPIPLKRDAKVVLSKRNLETLV